MFNNRVAPISDSDSDSDASDASDWSDATTRSSVSMDSRKKSQESSVTDFTITGTFDWFRRQVFSRSLVTREEKWFFMAKVCLVALIPVTALVVVCIRNIINSDKYLKDIVFTRQQMRDQVNMQLLITRFQEERGKLVARAVDTNFIADDELRDVYIATDEALTTVAELDWVKFWVGHVEIFSLSAFKYYLWSIRFATDQDLEEIMLFYSSSIRHFMSEMTKKSLALTSGKVGQAASIGIVITRAKEAIGTILAIGCPYFFTGNITSQEVFSVYQQRAFKYEMIMGARHQSLLFRQFYEEFYLKNGSNIANQVYGLMDVLLEERIENPGLDLMKDWYSNLTDYILIFAKIRDLMDAQTEKELENDYYWSLVSLIALGFVVGLILMCLPTIFIVAYHLVNNLQEFNSGIVKNLKTIKEEKRLAEDILLKMLPPSVAKQLKMKKAVAPEVYDSTSIFFSDVVGFTSISSKSTPMQVVAFLNQLYDFFDNVIDRYDCYKVETIGDAYMVTSGLPVRNGERHANEIACMAIDLRDGIEHMQIPHMVLHKLQLRIGLHSGPCVAGVVGLKMPRYCLFGQTVQIASKMESTGCPQQIQITRSMQVRLEKLGGHSFITEPRDTIQIEGIGEIERFWLIGRKTEFSRSSKTSEAIKHDILPLQLNSEHEIMEKQLERQDSNLFMKFRRATIKLLDTGKNQSKEENNN